MNLTKPIIAEFQHEAATTRKLLERVPQESFTWKPHEKSMTLGRLAGHLAELPSFFGPILNLEEMNFDARNYQPFLPTTVSEILEKFDENVAHGIELLKTQDEEHLLKKWRLRRGEQIFFELPRISVIRTMAINHIIHHRGQLSVYLRLLDVPLPSIYGPSADEEPAFQTAD